MASKMMSSLSCGRLKISSTTLFIAITLFWMAFANVSFFGSLLSQYPLNAENIGFLAAILFGFFGVIVMVLSLLCHGRATKPILIFLLMTAPFAAYFMDTYHIVIDRTMIHNMLETDVNEARDLFSITLLLYVLLLGIIPSWLVYRCEIIHKPFMRELISRIKLMAGILLIIGISYFIFSAAVSSFFREHKVIRFHFNPANYVFAIGKTISKSLKSHNEKLIPLGRDAATVEPHDHHELIIVVVGETARADRFSLNGYARKTNPLLEKERVISFSDFTSCGTSTAISVPCMFSGENGDKFDVGKSKNKENALDVLAHAGVNILWRDNNSSSKGVADRAEYQDYRKPGVNTICDSECRDEGMLVGLQDYIDAHTNSDIVIVLHQMGNHGPAYYKRYPKAFETFTPACQTNELSDCSIEAIGNAYDNAILYTDYFLAKTIELLKHNDANFETALLYVSDHGESLGENGLYLHGMPNFIAPDTQRKVPVIMWLGENFDEISFEDLYAKKDQPFSHDNIFHTLLDFLEIESEVYKEDMSLINH